MKVCCNACKKPVKASQYAAHAGFEVFSFEFFPFPFPSFLTLQAVIKIGVNVAYGSNNRAPCNEYKHFKVVEKHRNIDVDKIFVWKWYGQMLVFN